MRFFCIMLFMNCISESKEYKNALKERFIKYVKIWSESNSELADKGVFPSTKQQWDFAKVLLKELKKLGLKNVQLTKKCYVYANLPGTGSLSNAPSVLFLAHMDTVDEVTGKNVNPKIAKKPEEYSGDEKDTIITTDGTTLLGADDKAGVAAIITAVEYIIKNKIDHCPFELIFSPDEETGHGMDYVPFELIKSKFAYTVDGGDLGEMETECFNAFSALVTFTGNACHTGDAKKLKMVNATLMASNFISSLPQDKRPETTEKYQGFIAPMNVNGTIEKSTVSLLLRSFDMKEMEEEKKTVKKLAEQCAKKSGGTVTVSYRQQYLNMKNELDKNPFVVEKLIAAYKKAGVKIVNKPIRGGTDGSRLTELGIPTPNIFTGAHNFHSRNEWCSLNQMSKSADIIVNLLTE